MYFATIKGKGGREGGIKERKGKREGKGRGERKIISNYLKKKEDTSSVGGLACGYKLPERRDWKATPLSRRHTSGEMGYFKT